MAAILRFVTRNSLFCHKKIHPIFSEDYKGGKDKSTSILSFLFCQKVYLFNTSPNFDPSNIWMTDLVRCCCTLTIRGIALDFQHSVFVFFSFPVRKILLEDLSSYRVSTEKTKFESILNFIFSGENKVLKLGATLGRRWLVFWWTIPGPGVSSKQWLVFLEKEKARKIKAQ